jgi:hypothetical protein
MTRKDLIKSGAIKPAPHPYVPLQAKADPQAIKARAHELFAAKAKMADRIVADNLRARTPN